MCWLSGCYQSRLVFIRSLDKDKQTMLEDNCGCCHGNRKGNHISSQQASFAQWLDTWQCPSKRGPWIATQLHSQNCWFWTEQADFKQNNQHPNLWHSEFCLSLEINFASNNRTFDWKLCQVERGKAYFCLYKYEYDFEFSWGMYLLLGMSWYHWLCKWFQ